MKRKGFTLVELLTVMAILSILYAIAVPAFIAGKAAVVSAISINGLKELGQCTSMYLGDSDDMAPLAMYDNQAGQLETWFGTQTSPTVFDTSQGLLSPYEKGHPNYDPSLHAQPWVGDASGYGYNWGYIGSDFNMQPTYLGFPNCQNPANMAELTSPSTTILYATSSYFFAPWLPKGDGQTYEFNFIDPPRLWHGNPNIYFRLQGTKTVDLVKKTVISTGHANVVRADGSAKPKHMGDISDADFMR
jgi:prepilin-type N-terminal cleavage/methylation domain-containing protein